MELPAPCRTLTTLLLFLTLASPSAAVTYTYDTHHRLTSAIYDDGTAVQYTYDATGNRLAKSSTPATLKIYEDAEDGAVLGWDIYDNDPIGAGIVNIYDSERASRVIALSGDFVNNGYRLRNNDGDFWNDSAFKVLEWSLRYGENFVVYVAAQTEQGFRYIYYTPVDTDYLGSGTYVHHGLGSHLADGQWHTIARDLANDLKQAQPDNELQAVLGFLIRGSGRVDDIRTRSALPSDLDTDGDGLTDSQEISTHSINPYYADSDGDGIEDGDELVYWGANWSADPDGDSKPNLMDPDADNDGIRDGIEIRQGTNPADAASIPSSVVYEDAEDSDTLGWDIYDKDPSGATITNVYDSTRTSQVIELTGDLTNNGYRLRNQDGFDWNDTHFKSMEWSMQYSESFVVYIAVQTKNGFRYLYYTPVAANNLGADTYVHHGLGTVVKDGTWHTITRDLAQDLKDAQPDNELQAVLGFLIRGSGKVDDIKTK